MSALLRQVLFLALSAVLTWWALLRPPVAAPVPPPTSLRVAIETPPATPAEPEPEPAAAEPAPAEPSVDASEPDGAAAALAAEAGSPDGPPPPERGRPDGDQEGRALAEAEAEGVGEAPTPPEGEQGSPDGLADPAALAGDESLLERARAELAGATRQGFVTELVASAGDQLDIARSFGETLVLVPWNALDDQRAPADWFRLDLAGEPRVERVPGPFEPGRFRFHRDLFDYPYADLPDAVRALRRTVVGRDGVYLFAALIPAPEWAVVVGRRDEALARLGLTPDQVRRFSLRYVRRSDGRFDLRVERVERADGREERLTP